LSRSQQSALTRQSYSRQHPVSRKFFGHFVFVYPLPTLLAALQVLTMMCPS